MTRPRHPEIAWIRAHRSGEEIGDALRAVCDGLDVSPLFTHRSDLERATGAPAADPARGSSEVVLRLGPDRR